MQSILARGTRVAEVVGGGLIAAISENSVQYQKGGQMVTLSLPTG